MFRPTHTKMFLYEEIPFFNIRQQCCYPMVTDGHQMDATVIEINGNTYRNIRTDWQAKRKTLRRYVFLDVTY